MLELREWHSMKKIRIEVEGEGVFAQMMRDNIDDIIDTLNEQNNPKPAPLTLLATYRKRLSLAESVMQAVRCGVWSRHKV